MNISLKNFGRAKDLLCSDPIVFTEEQEKVIADFAADFSESSKSAISRMKLIEDK